MRILYLYSELMGYQIPVLKEYVNRYHAEVHIIHWDNDKLTPYTPPAISNVIYYKRSALGTKEIKEFVKSINPDIVYMSGWMDKGYIAAVRPLRKSGIPVVCGLDTIYRKTLKQRLAVLIFPFIKNKIYSHMWVAGPYQYEYAKRLGFNNSEIIFNCYSADLQLFNKGFELFHTGKKNNYPHRFLFAGRFEQVKGIDLLIQAWTNIKNARKDWELCLIGNGSMLNDLKKVPDIIIRDFMQPDQLFNEIGKSGFYILPSRFEPWALVLHEFSAAGLPIICSDVCGAAPVFVIPQYNGYTFKSNNLKALENALLKVMDLPDEQLCIMAENSHKCGQKITPAMTAASFLSIL